MRSGDVYGIYSKGMHDFILREIEIGFRAASYEDSEYSSGWSALDDLSFLEYMKANPLIDCLNCGHVFNPTNTRWICPECRFKHSCCEGEPA